jgi:hypothetical protein
MTSISGSIDRIAGRTSRAATVAALMASLLVGSLAAAQSTSPSYRLQPTTLNSGGGAATSATFRGDASLGQESAIGASSSFDYIVQSGFWSFLGSTVVPVVLSVGKHAGAPADVELAWSGNNAPYSIYRATAPEAIHGGAVFAMTSNNAYLDPAPPATALVCYSVFATAPGLQPPPPSAGTP